MYWSDQSLRSVVRVMCVLSVLYAGKPVTGAGADSNVTFNDGISGIIFENCTVCHHPGGNVPFELMNYGDVRKRGRQIAEVVESGYMPPWLPAEGYGEFRQSRRLEPSERRQILDWVADGMPEGAGPSAEADPGTGRGWDLGEPDLVVEMPEPFILPPEGMDVYRNFVIPVGIDEPVYVRGLELQPVSGPAVHHAFVKVDSTPTSRNMASGDAAPGFGGMDAVESATMPDGHFLSWQPGKQTHFIRDDLVWLLNPGDDLVLQMHLRPTGKAEKISARVGLWFSGDPPERKALRLPLISYEMDIPPGEPAYVVRDELTLPAAVDVLGVLPHAHYLGRELTGYAILPDGSRRWLINIPEWDFNWQGDYQYATPVRLPAGSVVHMEYTYDNSAENPDNPSDPPRRVRYGKNTTDEMAELWLQVVPVDDRDFAELDKAIRNHTAALLRSYLQFRVGIEPEDASAHNRLGQILMADRSFRRAEWHLRQAVSLDPGNADPHYFLGLLYRMNRRLQPAVREFTRAIELAPGNFKAHGNLGMIFLQLQNRDAAIQHFRAALRINPEDSISQKYLQALED